MDILYLCKSVFFLWCLLCVEALLCSVRGFQQSAPNHDVYMTLFKPELKKKKKKRDIQVNSFLSKARSYLANVFHFDKYFN